LSDAQLVVSVIIPTLNESSNIAPTISSIRAGLFGIDHEIIIVDNGSKDDTVKLSKRFADKVFVDESLTIGGLRNLGVENSSGSILIFNDADVLIADTWRREFDLLRETLKCKKMVVGGSLEPIESTSSLFECWFKPILYKKSISDVVYVGTGHMLLAKDLFFECNGFNERLISGEDSDFCQKARERNAEVIFSINLKTIHLGYPRSIIAFFKRELWHGKGDFQGLEAFLGSKVAMISFAMLLSQCAVALTVLSESFQYLAVTSIITFSFPLSYSFLKFPFKLGVKNRFANIWYSYIYLLARSLSWSLR
jgi:glycosyltransferase involved in cell wall biosynthesis